MSARRHHGGLARRRLLTRRRGGARARRRRVAATRRARAAGRGSAPRRSSVLGLELEQRRLVAAWAPRARGGASGFGAAGRGGRTFTAGMPIIVGVPALALRTTRPFDHNSSVPHPSQRTTACAGAGLTCAAASRWQLGTRPPSLGRPRRRRRGLDRLPEPARSGPPARRLSLLKVRSATFAAAPASTSNSVMVTRTPLSCLRVPDRRELRQQELLRHQRFPDGGVARVGLLDALDRELHHLERRPWTRSSRRRRARARRACRRCGRSPRAGRGHSRRGSTASLTRLSAAAARDCACRGGRSAVVAHPAAAAASATAERRRHEPTHPGRSAGRVSTSDRQFYALFQADA